MTDEIRRGRQYEGGPIEMSPGAWIKPCGATVPHLCDSRCRCRCPVHGTPMLYWPAGDDHACQDVTCEYGHGVRKMLLAADVALALDDDLPGATSITCPRCGMTSHNSTDVEQGCSGNCHDWTSPR